MLFEGDYLNGKKNGNAKEYDWHGNLIFEGEYLKGKRNGKGKDYNIKNKLMFEGEYLYGKKWNGKLYDSKDNNEVYEIKEGKGYVKEYNNEDKLIFNGYYLNGERNGKGDEYDDNGSLIFSGEFFKGKKWNSDRYTITSNIKYFLENGKGTLFIYDIMPNSFDEYEYLLFEGNCINGELNGKGKSYENHSLFIFEGV